MTTGGRRRALSKHVSKCPAAHPQQLPASLCPHCPSHKTPVQGYFSGSFVPGKPLESGGVGVVRASKADGLKEAQVVAGMFPWSTHFVLDPKQQVWPGRGGGGHLGNLVNLNPLPRVITLAAAVGLHWAQRA